MTSYQDVAREVGDQWVAAYKRTEDAVVGLVQNAESVAAKVDLPEFPMPESVAKFNDAIAEQLPKPSEIVQANFELTERVLTAQKDLALRLLDLASKDEKSPDA